jgi:endonuclease/exonuclease/phosphatase family metal-dependent hydrolase
MKKRTFLPAFIGAVLIVVPAAAKHPSTIRIATYNASLYGKKSGQILNRLRDGKDQQAEKVASVVQTIRPDVLLINEIDHDTGGATASALNDLYFAKPQRTLSSIDYPFVYSVASNTGVDSQLDLDQNGKIREPIDAWGFGVYPGQYSMAIYSRFPINESSIRTFQTFLWKDLPGAQRPVYPKTKQAFHTDDLWNQLRLSSKNHVDVPIQIGETVIHVLACHPTPPVFDGPEDRNGCRNHDEIKFWQHYLDKPSANWIVDDEGTAGGLAAGQSFVIMGDLNSDSVDGDGKRQAIVELLANERLYDPQPKSKGAVADSVGKKSAAKQKANPALDTAKFGGNLRVDYVLPSRTLAKKDAGVVWPEKSDPSYEMITASDHRMVWVEVEVP